MTTIRRLPVLLAAAFLAFAPAASADGHAGSAEEAQAMVARAIAHYDAVGTEAALATFNDDPAPEFADGDLYVFVFGPDGAIVAHGVDPSALGRKLEDLEDADGKRFGEEMLATASMDGTWVDYKWTNPVSGEIEPKSSWIVLHDGHLFGVGIYNP